jgi:hypothetical protein
VVGRGEKSVLAPALGALALAGLVVAWWATRFGPDEPREPLDTVLYFLPSYATIADHWRNGTVPLWNPYQLCGIPWPGTLQGGVFYPFHVLYLFLPLHQALAANGVLHLLIAAFGTAAFVRRLGLGGAAAFLAAVVFTLRGTVGTAVPAANFLEAVAWLPVGAVAIVDLVRAPGPRPVGVLAAATGLSFLAGYPQPTVYVVYTWGSLLLALLVHERPTARGIAARIATFAAALALGALVAAVQLAPALELMGSGTRASAGLSDRTMFPLAAWRTPATTILREQSVAGTPYAVGVVALSLVPAAAAAAGHRAIGVWALAMLVLSGLAALGRVTPLFDVYLALPALRLFRNPGRLLIVTDFAVAIAAAVGLSAVLGRGRAGDGRPLLPAVLAALGLAGVIVLMRRGWAPAGAEVAVPFAVVTSLGIVALLVARPSWRPAVGAALAMAAAVEIARNPGSGFRMPYAATDVAVYRELEGELRQAAGLVGHERAWRFWPGLQASQAHKLSTWYRLRSIGDYEPVNLQRQSDFFTYFRDGTTTATRRPWLFDGEITSIEAPPGGTPPATRRRLLDLAAVRWIVFRLGALTDPTVARFVAETGYRPRRKTDRFTVFENPHALPRAFVTYRTRTAPADPEKLLGMISAPTFDPLVESFVEGPPPFVAAHDAPPRGHAAAFVRDDETEVELEVALERPGLVVLADSFYPGWHATVDGAPAPIVATNHLFRGVPAPTGTHRVRFVYAPASVRIGGWVSMLAAIAVVGLYNFTRQRRG